ncbi:fucose isomerase [Marinicaulis aureus]|uniref:Fucose isomerase n=1 Tax=Hyphococcus aureus TaxID=2666033 RepID=A0ABW1KVT4_9PROT
MSNRVAIFWPGDYRAKPNELAEPLVRSKTEQMVRALKKLDKTPYVIDRFLTRPSEAIEHMGQVNDPAVGLFCHWVYGPHTVDGVVGKTSPLLLASNFDGGFPGLVGLLNTAACLELMERKSSRLWGNADDWTQDDAFMSRLEEWCRTGEIKYQTDELHDSVEVSAKAQAFAKAIAEEISLRRILILMLGDTSMGMTNGYFGPRVLARHGFAEHKVDQAWLPKRMEGIDLARVEKAFAFLQDKGVTFHWREKDAEDFTEDSTREQLRMYLAVVDLIKEFGADCLGWQYQLGLVPVTAPSDLCEGLFNSKCRPESDGEVFITATEADQGNVIPMEMMKRLQKKKGLHEAVMFHDIRWGGEEEGRFLWVLLNSGSCGAYAFNHNPDSLEGAHSFRQPAMYFPNAGGTFAGVSKPGKVTWARAYLRGDESWMDIGRGEVVDLPTERVQHYWQSTTPQWPIMMADLGCSRDALMAHFMSNHIAVSYGDIFEEMVALSRMLGFRVRVMSSTL